MSKKYCGMITLCEEICYRKPHILYSVSMIPNEVLKTYNGTCCFNGIIRKYTSLWVHISHDSYFIIFYLILSF